MMAQQLREELVEFYTIHDQNKLSSLDTILASVRKKGTRWLNAGLQAKYGKSLEQRPARVERWTPLRGGSVGINGTAPSETLRQFLLGPLLERLANDALVSNIVPYLAQVRSDPRALDVPLSPLLHQNSRHTVSGEISELRRSDDAGVALLSRLLSSLVQQIANVSASDDTTFDLHTVPQNSECSAEDGNSSFGYLRLLLSLQKHLLSWAASSELNAENPDVVRKRGTEAVDKHVRVLLATRFDNASANSSLPKATVNLDFDVAFPWRTRAGHCASWECLLDYAELVMRHCIRELTDALDGVATRSSHNSHIALLSILGRSVLGGVLRSLATGLSLFASRSYFALRLLPNIAELLSLVDRACCCLPSITAADEQYRRHSDATGMVKRPGEVSAVASGGQNNPLPSFGGYSTMRAMHSSYNNENSQCMHEHSGSGLPWLLELEKTLASLGGRFAATLVIGRAGDEGLGADSTGLLERASNSPVYLHWMRSSLLRGGLSASVMPHDFVAAKLPTIPLFGSSNDLKEGSACRAARFEGHCSNGGSLGMAHQRQQRKSTVSQKGGRGAPTSPRKKRYRKIPAGFGLRAKELAHFVQLIVLGEGRAKPVVERLRSAHARIDASYGMSLVQGRGGGGGDARAMDAIESSVFAVVLQHEGLLIDSYLYASYLAGRDDTITTPRSNLIFVPPPRLRKAWQTAAQLRMWLSRRRSILKAREAPDNHIDGTQHKDALLTASTDFSLCCEDVRRRACFLLLLSSANPAVVQPAAVPLGVYTSAYPVGFASDNCQVSNWCSSKIWWKLRAVFWCTVRWKRLVRSGKTIEAELRRADWAAQRTELADEILRFVSAGGDNSTDLKSQLPGPPHLGTLFLLMADNSRRACLRVAGLNTFRRLISLPTLVSPRADVIRSLAPALRQVSVGAPGSDVDVRDNLKVRASAPYLTRSGHYAGNLDGIGDAFMLRVRHSFYDLYFDLADALQHALSGGSACTQMQLLMLDAWAITVTASDLGLLSGTGLLQTLQCTLAAERDRQSSVAAGVTTSGVSPRVSGRLMRRGSTVNVKDWRQHQLGEAVWMLFRLLFAQVGEAKNDAELQPLLAVLHEEAESSLREMLPSDDANAMFLTGLRKGDLANNVGGNEDRKSGIGGSCISTSAGSAGIGSRRSQLIIGASRRFVNMEDGLRVPASEIIALAQDCSDFSVTLWFMLQQDSTGRQRVLLLRGNRHDRVPIIILRESDRRVEVGVTTSASCERIVSKEAMPLNKWTHIAVVAEGAKLRLFINGSLDIQRTNTAAPKHHQQLPFFVGKAPHDVIRAHGLSIRGGIEGLVAQLRFHTRALSPIHVRIVCDQGPPKHTAVRARVTSANTKRIVIRAGDRHTFQLVVLLQGLATSPLGLRCFAQSRWLRLQARQLLYGTPRVQQAVLRFWRTTLPSIQPNKAAEAILPIILPKSSSKLLESSSEFAGTAFVEYLFVQVGLGTWRGEGLENPVSGYEDREMNPSSLWHGGVPCDGVLEVELLRPLLVAALNTSVDGGAVEEGSGIEIEVSYHAFALASELVMLLRVLATSCVWCKSVRRCMSMALKRLHGSLSGTMKDKADADASNFDIKDAYVAVATLAVLGGHTDCLRVGGKKHTNITATVVGYDAAARSVLVVMASNSGSISNNNFVASESTSNTNRDPASCAGPDNVASKPERKPLKTVHVNAEELVPIPEVPSPFIGSGVNTELAEVRRSFLTLLCSLFDSTFSVDSAFKGFAKRRVSDLFFARNRACAVKVLHTMLQSPDTDLRDILGNEIKGFETERFLQALLKLSVVPASRLDFMPLEEVEARTVLLRRRIHELNTERSDPDKGHDRHDNSNVGTRDDGKSTRYGFELSSQRLIQNACSLVAPSGDSCGSSGDGIYRQPSGTSRTNPPSELVQELMAMGFPEEWCVMALRENGLDMVGASTWIVDNLDILSSAPMRSFVGMELGDKNGPIENEENGTSTNGNESGESELGCYNHTGDTPTASFEQLEDDGGDAVFAESYFATDAAPGYNCGYSCGTICVYGTDCNRRSRRELLATDVASLEYDQLLLACSDAENMVSTLYARSCLLVILQRWRQWPPSAALCVSTFTHDASVLVDFLMLMAFRGPQIVPSYEVALLSCGVMGGSGTEDLPGLASVLPACDGSPAALLARLSDIGVGLQDSLPISATLGAAGSVMTSLLKALQPALQQLLRREALGTTVCNGPNASKAPLAEALCLRALDDIEIASSREEFAECMWGARELVVTDAQALSDPNVEFAAWILGLLQSECCAVVHSVETFRRLVTYLRTPNMPVKAVIFRLLTAALRYWEVKICDDDDPVLEDIDEAALLLPIERLRSLACVRLKAELVWILSQFSLYDMLTIVSVPSNYRRASGRVMFSRHLCSLTELIVVLERWHIGAARRRANLTTAVQTLAPSTEAEHVGTACAFCRQSPIVGVRFWCMNCPRNKTDIDEKVEESGYNLCLKCEASGNHGHDMRHVFAKIRRPVVPIIPHSLSPLSQFTEAPLSPVYDAECHADAGVFGAISYITHSCECAVCGMDPIEGPRYMCAHCVNFDVCAGCEEKIAQSILSTQESPLHNARHVFVKLPLPVRPNALKLSVSAATELSDALAEQTFLPALYACPPTSPSAPVVTDATESTLTLAWQPAIARGSPVTCYIVEIEGCFGELGIVGRKGSTSNDKRQLQVSSTCSGITIDKLGPSRRYRCRIWAQSPEGDGEAVCILAVTADDVPFVFDVANCGPNISISDDGMSATFSSLESWSTVLCTAGFMVGCNHWEVRVEHSSTAYVFVGVATAGVNLATFLGGDEHGWGYIGDRALYHRRNKVKVYGERFGQGDIIGVTLDMDRGTLSFSKNGVDLGVAADGLSGQLFPAFAFYNRSQRISFIRHAFLCPGAGVAVEGSPSESTFADVLHSAQLLELLAERKPLPKEFMRCAFERYNKWVDGRTKRALTRLGFELTYDVSHEACSKYGFVAGERLQTPRGCATVVGVADHKIWFLVDGDSGAWFFGERELLEKETQFIPLERRVLNDHQDDSYASVAPITGVSDKPSFDHALPQLLKSAIEIEEKNSRGELEEKTHAISKNKIASLCPEYPKISECEFVSWASTEEWTPEFDAALIAEVSMLCEHDGTIPWNVTPAQLATVTLPAVKRRLRSCGAPISASPEDSAPSAAKAAARFAVLCLVNEHLIALLPFIDTCTGTVGAVDGLVPLRLRKGGSRIGSGAEAICQIASLSQKLRFTRGLVFLHTKRRLLRAVLERTATKPKKAEDDYDYPEDLPQVLLNRPKAAFSRVRQDAECRLSYSLFGQAFDELHFLEAASLRMGYTHPMDDGQQRTFKVKFEGEGVDDYGGPYRECFAQFCAELSCVTTLPSGAADLSHGIDKGADSVNYDENTKNQSPSSVPGGSLKCVLPLFHPSPNRQHAIGSSREKLILKPASSISGASGAHLLLEMYNFLGQVIGIAIRTSISLNIDLASVILKPLVSEALSEEDLRAVDYATVAIVERLCTVAASGIENDKAMQAVFEELQWTTRLSDGTEAQLLPGGLGRAVESDSYQQYIDALLSLRLRESERALNAMRDGLVSIVPDQILPLFTGNEFEWCVCGRGDVDVDLLRSCTEYDDDISPDDPHIVSFWRVLRSFSVEQRRRFLRFVWARSRLPATSREFTQRFKIQAPVGEGPRDTPDTYLPKAHTCFFSLNLPRYSSDAVMREKLLYAVNNCLEMDADFRLAENEMTGWGIDATEAGSQDE